MIKIRNSVASLTLLVWAFALVSSLHTHSRARSETVIASGLGIVLLALLGFIVGIEMFFRGFRALRRKWLIENTPTSTVRGAAIGQVEVCGKVVGPYILLSPLSLLDCYYYKAVAWQAEGSGQRKQWKKAGEEVLCVPFFIEDETGRLLVDPRDAEIDVAKAFDEEGSIDTVAENVRRFAERRGIRDWSCAKLEEYCIKAGDTLYVLGTLCENKYGEDVGQSFLSEAAADLQRRSVLEAMNVALPEYRQPGAAAVAEFDLQPAVILRKSRRPFLISSQSQRDIVAHLTWTSTLSIWGGPILALVSLGVLLQRLNLW
jgi:hypothetical protein